MTKGNILVIDDEEDTRHLLSRLINLENYKAFEAGDGNSALKLISEEDFGVIITDVRLPDINGIDLIRKIRKINSYVEIIVLTGYGTVQDGVRAIKEGAFDYITKGDEDKKIISLVEKAFDKASSGYKINDLEKKFEAKFSFENIAGSSKEIKETIEIAEKIAQTDLPVLLIGETGSGKELFAQSIHNASGRKNSPFITANCSSMSANLLESKLFGYGENPHLDSIKNKTGLFEKANSGTIFIDEVGEIDLSLQAKLLSVFEMNSFIKPGYDRSTNVDVRIIAATNRDLEKEIERNIFRSDLYYRMAAAKIEIPPLRNRKEDIEELVRIFINDFSKKLKRNMQAINNDFLDKLKNYNFPGNVRELKNIIKRAIILTDGEVLKSSSLPNEFFEQKEFKNLVSNSVKLNEIEKHHILKILDKTHGNKTRAARMLGIGLTTLYRKLHTYNLE